MSACDTTAGLPRGTLALVFVAPYDSDTRIVNLATGRYGYDHVALWGGHMKSGEPMLLDAGIGWGVGFRPQSLCAPGRSRSTELGRELSCWIWRRAMAEVGCAYDYVGLVRSRRPCGRYTCSGLVAACLPEHMRIELPGRVSPNDLARYFGVPPMEV